MLYYTYGLYLLHGGTPEGFEKLTMDDVQAMYLCDRCSKDRDMRMFLEALTEILGKARRWLTSHSTSKL